MNPLCLPLEIAYKNAVSQPRRIALLLALTTRDDNSAFALAAKANLLTSGGRPQTLDMLGMACAELGKFDEAQMAAQPALEVAAALKMNETNPIQQRLELYKNHLPWRESFQANNASVND